MIRWKLALLLLVLVASCATPQPATYLSEEHEFLHRFRGDWKMEGWGLAEGEAESVAFSGRFRCTPILDGRFLRMETEGSLDGDPWLANALVGYDMEKEEFQSVSVTAKGTGLSAHATGRFNDARDGFIVERKSTHPDTGRVRTLRYEHRALEDRLELQIFAGTGDLEQVGFYECTRR